MKPKKKLLIFGSVDSSKILGNYLLDDNSKYQVVAYIDDSNCNNMLNNIPIMCSDEIHQLNFDYITSADNSAQELSLIKKLIKKRRI